jgi:hypothetical protein
MARATNRRDGAHARIYSEWLSLPAWRNLSPTAVKLLVEILGRYRPGDNGRLPLSARLAGEYLNASKATGARALRELDDNGWIRPMRLARFADRKGTATDYKLTMFTDDETGEMATREYLDAGQITYAPVSPMRPNGGIRETKRSQIRDAKGKTSTAIQISDALKKLRLFNR